MDKELLHPQQKRLLSALEALDYTNAYMKNSQYARYSDDSMLRAVIMNQLLNLSLNNK